MKIYRATDGDTEPVKKYCDVFGYRKCTTDGETIDYNTHFKTEQKAWNNIMRISDDRMYSAGADVVECEKRLQDAKKTAAQAARDYSIALRNCDAWRSRQDTKRKRKD